MEKSGPSSAKKSKDIDYEEDDGISLPSASDMDGKVNALLNSGISDSSSEEELDLSKLKQDYLDDTETGPAINNDLAELFNSIKKTDLSKEKVALKAKEHPKPENCSLETKQVNPEILSSVISTRDRNLDLQIQKSQTLITKASYALLKVADSAITLNKEHKREKLGMKDIIKNATDSLAFMASAHSYNEKLRRHLILKKLAQEQRSIGKEII